VSKEDARRIFDATAHLSRGLYTAHQIQELSPEKIEREFKRIVLAK
jgi:hypothetical protein